MEKNIISYNEPSPEKPTCLISMCICGVPCRYHGLTHKMGYRLYKEGLVARLKAQYNLIPVCPEILGGLPTPRCPCVVAWQDETPQVSNRDNGEGSYNGINLTEAYQKGAKWTLWLAQVFGAKKAVFLKKSPACDPVNGVAARLLASNGVFVRGV